MSWNTGAMNFPEHGMGRRVRTQERETASPPFSRLRSSTEQHREQHRAPWRVPAPRPAPHEGHRRPPTLPAPSPTHTRSATVFRYRSREKQPPRQLDSLPAPSLGRDAPAMRVTLWNFHGRRFRTRRARPARLGQTPDTSGLNARAGSFVKLLRHPR